MLKAEIEIGHVKVTPNQQKKHYTQFTKKEKLLLKNKIASIDVNHIWGSLHLKDKKTITYNPQDIYNVLKKHNIIEYNLTKTKLGTYDKRVLLRGLDVVQTDKGAMNLCVVLSLKNDAIVTVYYNSAEQDTHKKLNMNRYNRNLEVRL